MTTPEEIFENAISGFKTLLSEAQIDRFTTTTLPDVKVTIISMQNDQDIVKKMINLKRLHSFVDAFEQFDEVCRTLEIGIASLSGYIWGPAKFILQTAKDDTKVLDCVLESYSKLGQRLPLVARFKSQLRERPEMQKCLAWMYHDLLQFNAATLKLFDTRSWGKTFVASWKDNDGPFKTLLHAFYGHKKVLEDFENIQEHQILQETQRRLNDLVLRHEVDRESLFRQAEAQEIDRKKTQYLEVISWLKSPGTVNFEKEYQEEFEKVWSTYPDTGRWILREEKVDNWINAETPPHSILWINGKKGAGKTILASLIVEQLEKHHTDFKTSYFYCRETDEKSGEQQFLTICKSLLRQLVKHNRDLLPTLHEKRMDGLEVLNSETTAKTLLELFSDTTMKQFIVIDGLDELLDNQRRLLLQCLAALVDRSDNYSPGKIRLLLISTPLADMKARYMQSADKVDFYELHADNTQHDIKLYVANQARRLEEELHIGNHYLELIQSLICKNANGMFLYAFLVMDNLLQQPNISAVVAELSESTFPAGLAEAYNRIIERLVRDLHPNSWIEARKIFSLLVCAKRPLKWYEVQAVLSMNVDEKGRVLLGNPAGRLGKQVQEVCGSLIQVIGGNYIEFIHDTAKVLIASILNEKSLECDMVLLCLGYLSHTCFDSEHDEATRRFFAETGHYAFQDYAISMWASHMGSLLKTSVDLFNDSEQGLSYRTQATKTMAQFCQVYHHGLEALIPEQREQSGASARDAKANCQAFQHENFYEHLVQLWTHIFRHQKQKIKERNEVSIKELGGTLLKTRLTLETIASEPRNDELSTDKFIEFYGHNHYKCTRVTCAYFYEGYDSKRALENHLNRHERPFTCIVEGCSVAPFGFSSNKDRDRHIRNYHPDEDQVGAFPHIGQAPVQDARFQCDLCSRSYTRQANLAAHRDSIHLGRRPYACSTCGREFTRRNDRARHERNQHVRRG